MTTTPRTRRAWRLAVVAIVTAVGLSGCGLQSIQEVPLPGGASLGDHPYDVTALFTNVVDLVPNASVRTNDVPVGVVREVRLAPDGWTAEVTMSVNGDVMLPANAMARLRQTSLLGEKFVELGNPAIGAPQGRLQNGAVIPLDRSDVGAQVEEVLGALSLLLNGGGVEKIQTISRELNNTLGGNEAQIRALLDNLNVFVGTLDKQRSDIVRALDSLDRLSATLVTQRAKIANVIDNLQPGLDVLNQQRGLLVGTLQALQRLSVVGTDVINRAGQNTIADLTALQPILQNLIASGDALPGSLQILLTIPFADNSLNVIKGDFANIDVTVEISLQGLLQNLLGVNPAAGNLNQIFALLQNQQTARATGNPLIALPGVLGANTAPVPTTTTTTGAGTGAAPAATGGGTGTGTGTTGTTGGGTTGTTGTTGSTQGEGN
ncbi:MCE family protein [Actinomycetospora corticicola]|uniref:Phospholipid/cholesterol/gamma-HCH transport system substrate-binding protein n=1 Tax=Actinomycetospora corticicola TaxID=663602 RepID=A0A7Y9J6Z1_9PSEU|nr:phospholipid/cholesterol/gamma-HCH transport system substrate-binding protein [Actinomycetospora corticicola]